MKKILTIILDGFGMREDIYGNAIKNAGMKNFINLWNNYPHCLLRASGTSIGLPDKQCGCSTMGHEIIGAGRSISNKLTEINEIFKKDRLKYNTKYTEMIDYLKKHKDKSLHITHLLSDGGVSSHINHLKGFLNELKKSGIENNIYLHIIADGRDSNKYSIYKYISDIETYIIDNIHISSICGRYYALDETNDYRRTKMFYDMLFEGRGIEASNIEKVIAKCYQKHLSDEYLPPLLTEEFHHLEKDDVLMILNYSKENQMQFLNAITNNDFVEFNNKTNLVEIYSLYEIDETKNTNYFFKVTKHHTTLPEYLSILGLTQAHIFETIKSPSMTYYLNGKRTLNLDNCDTYSVTSPEVDSFDMKPEMNSLSIAKTVIKCMEQDYDVIIANFANPDEVGHTGNYQATINSLQAVDVCLGKIIEVAEDNFYKVIITSSHGKADTIIDRDNNIITKNTLSPVPFMIIDESVKLKNGDLISFAPTLLKYMDIAIPKEMKDSEILLEKEQK